MQQGSLFDLEPKVKPKKKAKPKSKPEPEHKKPIQTSAPKVLTEEKKQRIINRPFNPHARF